MAGSLRVAWLLQAGLLLLASPVVAQVRFGETSTDLNGTISSGYTANYGNLTGSTHAWTVGGQANLTGSFHSPNFLSFSVSPYLNQSRANSNFQSITDASGVNASFNIFAGSSFPGSIGYSKAYNSEGNYAVPGLANFVTHGNSDTFSINWSENLPDKPSFSAGYQLTNSQYSVYGTNNEGKNTDHSINLHSGYQIAGISMGAYYSKGAGHSTLPQVLAGQVTNTHTDNSAYGFNAGHMLPWHGSISAGVNRTNWDSDYLGYRSSGTIDTVNGLASVHPLRSLSFTGSVNYSDNLAGELIQSVFAAGGVIPGLNSNESSNSLDLMGVTSYAPLASLQTSAFVDRRTQSYLGQTYGVTSSGGSVNYTHTLLNGNFNAALSLSANSSDNSGQDSLGFSTTENYSSMVLGWHVNETFGYAQNVQTLLVTYMNSYYNYSGNVRRNWGQFNLSAGAGGARTALTQHSGTANSSQSYNASAGYGVWVTANGSYSKSDGQALATGAGLVPVPIPSPILPSSLVSLFGGKSYSVAVSSSPEKKLILSVSYAKSTSNTSSNSISSSNQNNQFNSLIQYQFRKMYFTSGYARLEQGFSGSGTKAEVISSYYVGVSRWFNFF